MRPQFGPAPDKHICEGYCGSIDYLGADRITGWVWKSAGSGSILLDIYVDSWLCDTIVADRYRPDLAEHNIGDGRHGFEYSFSRDVFAGRNPEITLRVHGTDFEFQGAPFALDSASRVVGCIDDVTDGVVRGWVYNVVEPAQTPRITLTADDQYLADVRLDQLRPDLDAAGFAPGTHGFDLELPRGLRDGNEHNLALKAYPTGASEFLLTQKQVVIDRLQVGHIDSIDNHVLRGWRIDYAEPDSTAPLDIYVDGVFYDRLTSGISRPNIAVTSGGFDKHGFEYRIPLELLAASSVEVELRFVSTNLDLKPGPVWLADELALDSAQLWLSRAPQKGNQELRVSVSDSESRIDERNFKARAQTRLELTFPGHHLTVDSRTAEGEVYRRATHRQLPQALIEAPPVTIVVTVFNAASALRECLKSVREHTTLADAALCIVDDASTENLASEVANLASQWPQVELITNNENLGYTRSVNLGLARAQGRDVVLLNSDTKVGPRWLENLRAAAYTDPQIGTVTPISNNAGAFSFPDAGTCTPTPTWLRHDELSRSISQNGLFLRPEMPTGNGFCLYIKASLIEQIGTFDEAGFPRGYGEENDFCMRAVRAGWRHIIDDRTFIHHLRSASFGTENKKPLYESGQALMTQRYPDYRARVSAAMNGNRRKSTSYRVRQILSSSSTINLPPRPRALYVVSTQTGGTPQTNKDLMGAIRRDYHPLLLRCDRYRIMLYDFDYPDGELVASLNLNEPLTMTMHHSAEYDALVTEILLRQSIEILHIRHLAWHSLSLPRIAAQLGIPVIFSFHDFYTICPTVKLLDEENLFCAGRCTRSKGECKAELWNAASAPPLKHHYVKTWQQTFGHALEWCDAFVTTSRFARTQVLDVYPHLSEKPFSVIPHGRDFAELDGARSTVSGLLPKRGRIRVLFPGNINTAKGAALIADVKALDVDQRFEFHFLGNVDAELETSGVCHGHYRREEFAERVAQIAPHLAGVFSIWPETYCHTLTECWAVGVPVLVSPLGATADRMQRHGGGWVMNGLGAAAVHAQLMDITSNPDSYMEAVAKVCEWQASYGRFNNCKRMANAYADLYEQVVDARRPFQEKSGAARPIVGVVFNQNSRGGSPPSAHIRLLERFAQPDIKKRYQFRQVELSALMGLDEPPPLDALLVQRDACPAHLIDELIQWLDARGIPLIVEMDDDLFHVPADKDPDGVYDRYAGRLKRLVQQAHTVVTSTAHLRDQLIDINPNVRVLENALHGFTWLRPISEPREAIDLNTDTVNILYMGNPTHDDDLQLVRPAVERLSAAGKIKFHIIGGTGSNQNPGEQWYCRIPVPQACDGNYRAFTLWFRQVATRFDFAIAPLQETEFNASKSYLKYLDYAAGNLPALYSARLPYTEVVRDGENGILVADEDWDEALEARVADLSWTAGVVQAAYKDLVDHHLLAMQDEKLYEILDDVLLSRVANAAVESVDTA